jgi:hypothetical protein
VEAKAGAGAKAELELKPTRAAARLQPPLEEATDEDRWTIDAARRRQNSIFTRNFTNKQTKNTRKFFHI